MKNHDIIVGAINVILLITTSTLVYRSFDIGGLVIIYLALTLYNSYETYKLKKKIKEFFEEE